MYDIDVLTFHHVIREWGNEGVREWGRRAAAPCSDRFSTSLSLPSRKTENPPYPPGQHMQMNATKPAPCNFIAPLFRCSRSRVRHNWSLAFCAPNTLEGLDGCQACHGPLWLVRGSGTEKTKKSQVPSRPHPSTHAHRILVAMRSKPTCSFGRRHQNQH